MKYRLICEKREELNLTYDQRDQLIQTISEDLQKAPVMIGSLYYSDVVKFDCTTSDTGDIKSIDLTFKNKGFLVSVFSDKYLSKISLIVLFEIVSIFS
jgi:hypothetical protein